MTRPVGRPITVVLVDDHSLVRLAVRQTITAPDIEVVGEAASGREAVALVLRLRPDVVFLDVGLPGMGGLEVVRALAPRLPGTRIVMLTVSADDSDVLEAMQAGAAGFLTKDVSPEALTRAVHGAVDGDLVVRNLSDRARSAATDGLDPSGLTERERVVLRHLADGYTDREIAEALTLSPRTVETHVANLLRKLNVTNRREAARRYRSHF